jgi:dinuclear metal center YbgI/SA1388 family protein
MGLVKDVISAIESFAPPWLQESYDNSGLQTGDQMMQVTGILITLDVTMEVVDEAIRNKCNLIVAHHPVTLSGIKRLTGNSAGERILIKSIKNDVAIYAAHTNLDSVKHGVSGVLADKLGLFNRKILEPKMNHLVKLVAFVPVAEAEKVRNAIFESGAGHIGAYDCCSFNSLGEGTFRGTEETNPFVGEKGQLHTEPELRIEVILPVFIQDKVVSAMISAHPYEEPAYDLYMLNNKWHDKGFGIVGDLPESMKPEDFLQTLKDVTGAGCIRYTASLATEVSKVAVCGGSGSSLLKKAISAGADAFVTGDFKYHQFFEGENRIVIADIGHYESEQFTKELFFEILTKKLPNFAIRLSQVNSNPIKYL